MLLNAQDRESGLRYSELAYGDEFLGSHVLRIPSPADNGKEGTNVRDSRGKAKQFTTVNGRTVIIKESVVYSNKGILSWGRDEGRYLLVLQASKR